MRQLRTTAVILFPLLLLLAGAGPSSARAQDRSVGDDFEFVARDAWHIISSPARTTADDARTLGLLAGGFGVLLLADEPIQAFLREHNDSWPVRAAAPFREGTLIALFGRTRQFLLPLSATLYTSGLIFDNHDLRDAGMGCATSNVVTTLSRSALALLLGRLRPAYDGGAFVIEPFAFGGWEMRSFPGGHASNIMSCASYFNHRFDLGVAEPLLYGVAAAVGSARILDEAHWTSDTFFGMAYGYSIGKEVARRLDQRARERAAFQDAAALTIGWRIRF